MKQRRVALVLDRSGSMSNVVGPTVTAFNEQVEQLRINAAEGDNILVSLVTFNESIYEHFWDQPPSSLELASPDGYRPAGGTNIWDAIGYCVDRYVADTDTADEDNDYTIVLISDGRHGSARKWTQPRLAEAVCEFQGTGRWTFTVLGCDPSVLSDISRQTGIPLSNMGLWSQRSQGAAAGSAAGSAHALGKFLRDTRGLTGRAARLRASRHFYAEADGCFADFGGGAAREVDAAAALSAHSGAGGVLRSCSFGPDAGGAAAQAEPEFVPKYGTADVFGTGKRVI